MIENLHENDPTNHSNLRNKSELTILPQQELKNKNWYRKGLRFQCTECGKCCTGAPGYVWVTPEEIIHIADYVKLSIEDFSQRYLRKIRNRWSLKEDRHSFDCVFLTGKKCSVYSVRPKQCRTFPWWLSNLRSPEDWERASRECEGINDKAPLIPYEEIQSQLHPDLSKSGQNRQTNCFDSLESSDPQS